MSKAKKPEELTRQDVITEILEPVKELDQKVDQFAKDADKMVDPVRRSALRRFPTLFILLTTFGVATVFFAFEILIMQQPYLFERPLLVLFIGVIILSFTGTLYKKLG